MEKIPEILGTDGLTATSANHIANIAKEMYEALEARMSSIRLYNRDYTLAVNGQSYRVENESSREELESLESSLREVASLKSLIAWLREGIKAKGELGTKDAEREYIDMLIAEGHRELDDIDHEDHWTFESVLAERGIDELARYYSLEAKCATLGKYIHPDGSFAKARGAFFDVTKNPTSVSGKGQDAEISTYTSSFSAGDVDAEFFSLQKTYRSLQAELNKLKADIESTVNELEKKRIEKAMAAHREQEQERQLVLLERSDRIKALKIVIPQSLKAIYEKVNAVASAK